MTHCIAIISANPNLKKCYTPQTHHRSVIAVNSAAGLFPCDFWSCGDAKTFARVEPLSRSPLPALFTLTESDNDFKAHSRVAERFLQSKVMTWKPVRATTGAPAEAVNWSITAALMLAVELGADAVEVYGHYGPGDDPANVTDCAGFELKKRLDTKQRVMADWNITKAWAVDRGVTVREIHPPSTTTEDVI